MKNLADAIESFIIGELLREHEDTVLVQRNELAERFVLRSFADKLCAQHTVYAGAWLYGGVKARQRRFCTHCTYAAGGKNTQAAYSIAAGAAFAAAEDDYSKRRRFAAVYVADYRRR